MASKATPIEQLPNQPNIEMQTERISPHSPQIPVQPPQNYQDAMSSQQRAEQQAEQMASQEQFQQRQFVPQYPPSHDPYTGQQMPPQPMQQMPEPSPMANPPFMMPQNVYDVTQATNEDGYFTYLQNNSKLIFSLFVIMFLVQTAGAQQLLRKVATIIRVPEGMVYTGAKVLGAIIGAILFLVVKKYL